MTNLKQDLTAGLTTDQFAQALELRAQSIRKRFCQTGSYFGVRPSKLPNGRLRWPTTAVLNLVKGDAS